MSFIKIHPDDNVATAMTAVAAGRDVVLIGGEADLQTVDDIPANHKVALSVIPADAPIIKHGVTIGYATRRIEPGQHVHTQNTIGVQDYQIQRGEVQK